MLSAALRGTGLGLAGASAGLLVAFSLRGAAQGGPAGVLEGLAGGLFISAFMVFLATPGAFLLAFPLTSTLRFAYANVPRRRPFLLLGSAAGIPLGLVNLYLAHALLDLLLGNGIMVRWDVCLDPILGPASITGGAGLGLGVALAVWRGAHPPIRCGGEWRGTC